MTKAASKAAPASVDDASQAGGKKKGGKKKLILLGLPVILALVGTGLWFTGIIPAMLGKQSAEAHGAEPANPAGHAPAAPAAGAHPPPAAAASGHGAAGKDGKEAAAPRGPNDPVFAEVPDIVANLNAGARRTSFVKLRAKLELSKPEDQQAVAAAMPRVVDLFSTYLREMRPEDLRGSAGTWRLREELTARATLAVAPARVRDVLFTELLVQ